jgi:hypothetical protein
MSDLFTRKDCPEAFAPTHAHLSESFRGLALELSAIGQSIDVTIRAFSDPSLPHFAKLTTDEQQNVVMQLARYVSICQDVLASGGSLRSTRTFVWRAFREFGWTPNSSFFNAMSDDHVIEIYDRNNLQIFRNFRFFELCSYTLEDVFTRPWTTLFRRRDQAQTERLIKYVETMFAIETRETLFVDVGIQNTQETDSELRRSVDLEVEVAALLFDKDDKPEAFIVCERAEFAPNTQI